MDTDSKPRLYPKSNLPNLGHGRPKGARNHATTVAETLRSLGFDPIREAVKRFRDEKTPAASKDYCLGIVTDRFLPKLKAIEITGTGASDLRSILINIVAGNPAPAAIEAASPPPQALEYTIGDDTEAEAIEALDEQPDEQPADDPLTGQYWRCPGD